MRGVPRSGGIIKMYLTNVDEVVNYEFCPAEEEIRGADNIMIFTVIMYCLTPLFMSWTVMNSLGSTINIHVSLGKECLSFKVLTITI